MPLGSSWIELQNMGREPAKPVIWHVWKDVETDHGDLHLYNDQVESITWQHLSVSVTEKASGRTKYLLQDIGGTAKAGAIYESKRSSYSY